MKIEMDDKIVLARIDLLGMGVADTAKYVTDDEIMWDVNQATIALQEAFKKLSKKVKK